MQAASLTYKLIRKVKDNQFDEEKIDQYDLLMNIGTKDFQLLVLEPEENKVLLLEDFVLPGLSSNEELLQILDQLFDAHAFLKAGFWHSIRISVKNQKFVQVPASLFTPESAGEYLKFNASVDLTREECLATYNERAQAVTVFAINSDLKNWLLAIYPGKPLVFTHQSAALIEGTMQFAQKRADKPLYIYVDRFKLHIIACDQGRLLYYNQFAIKQFSEYVKYIMLVMNSLHMNQQTSQVVLWGYIGKASPHYNEFYKYISNVTFGGLPGGLAFGYVFDELPQHHYFDLYSINLMN